MSKPGWVCGTSDYSLGILGNTWGGELKTKKSGFPACGMEIFHLGIKERITLNAGKPGDSWVTMQLPLTGSWQTWSQGGGGHSEPCSRKKKCCWHRSAQSRLHSVGRVREHGAGSFISAVRGPRL